MKITIYGDVENKKVIAAGTVYSGLFDPNGLLAQFDNQSDLQVELELRISKKGNLVALVKDIKIM